MITNVNKNFTLIPLQHFETTLKSWVDRKKLERQLQPLADDDIAIVKQFAEASIVLIER